MKSLRVAVAACLALLTPVVAGAQPEDADDAAKLTYTGNVVDASGRPVAGAVVFADNGGTYQTMQTWDEVPWRLLVPDPLARADLGPWTVRGRDPTAADGTFRVEGVHPPAGEGWVVVVHPDHPAERAVARGAVRDGVLAVGTVRLGPGLALTATVTDADGTPVSGAWVVARPGAGEAGRVDRPSPDAPGEARAGRTASDGTCTIRGLRAHPYRVAAFTETTRPTEVEVTPALASPATCRIALTPGASARVEVVIRGTGAPVEGARIVLDRPIEGGMSFPGPAPLGFGRTDRAGVAQFHGLDELPEFSVSATPPDFAGDTIHHPGAFHVGGVVKTGGTIRLEMDAARMLRVRLIDAYTKQPVEGAKLKLVAVWDRYDRTGGSPVDLAMQWDAATRTYTTSQIRPGTWTVLAWAQGWLPGGMTNVVVPRDGDVPDEVVELGPAAGSVAGRVVAASTGEPVAGVTVSSYEWVERVEDGHRASAATGADGSFRLSPMLGADFPLNLTIDAPGWCREFLQWPKEKRVADVGAIRLTRAATIRGRVLAADGTTTVASPLANVAVDLVEAEIPQRGKGDGWTATTDAEGRFEFTGLRPGTYLLGGRRSTIALRVTEGGTAEHDVLR